MSREQEENQTQGSGITPKIKKGHVNSADWTSCRTKASLLGPVCVRVFVYTLLIVARSGAGEARL